MSPLFVCTLTGRAGRSTRAALSARTPLPDCRRRRLGSPRSARTCGEASRLRYSVAPAPDQEHARTRTRRDRTCPDRSSRAAPRAHHRKRPPRCRDRDGCRRRTPGPDRHSSRAGRGLGPRRRPRGRRLDPRRGPSAGGRTGRGRLHRLRPHVSDHQQVRRADAPRGRPPPGGSCRRVPTHRRDRGHRGRTPAASSVLSSCEISSACP